MRSVISDNRECWVCRNPQVEKHHIYEGPLRKKSERYGAWVYLCPYHHRIQGGINHNPVKELDLRLKRQAQRELEKKYGHPWFMNEFHRNWLEEEE